MNVFRPWVCLAAVVLLACGGSCLFLSCVPVVGGTMVDVELDEFTVSVTPESAPAGTITFRVANVGEMAHEFLVIKTDLAPDALPTEENGAYQENGAGTQVIDEISFISSGSDDTLTIDLEAGNYVLICNFSREEIHYELGMHAAFTVE
jgi:uncharacterized cupredoxin-like copper-binding protein